MNATLLFGFVGPLIEVTFSDGQNVGIYDEATEQDGELIGQCATDNNDGTNYYFKFNKTESMKERLVRLEVKEESVRLFAATENELPLNKKI